MKKLQVFGISLIILIIIFSNFVFALRVNEVMPDPADNCGDCTEWIELYSSSPTNLTNWIINTTNEKTNFSFYIEDYLIITRNKTIFNNLWVINDSKIVEWKGMSLKNSGEGIFLFDDNLNLVYEVNYPTIPTNKTYSLLSNFSWIICNEPTPGRENSCQNQQSQNNQTQQNQTNQTDSQENQTSSKIYLELEYNEEVGKDFEVNITAFNLNGSYDVKVYLEDNGTIISEIYDVNWKSGSYYVNNFFNGTGNKSGSLKLRLQKKYENFTGEAAIYGKIRNNNKIIDEFSDNITVIKEEETIIEKDSNDESLNGSLDLENIETESSIIRLNEPKDIKSAEIWKSKTQYIKEYAIYGFTLLCVIIIILLLIRKSQKSKISDMIKNKENF